MKCRKRAVANGAERVQMTEHEGALELRPSGTGRSAGQVTGRSNSPSGDTFSLEVNGDMCTTRVEFRRFNQNEPMSGRTLEGLSDEFYSVGPFLVKRTPLFQISQGDTGPQTRWH